MRSASTISDQRRPSTASRTKTFASAVAGKLWWMWAFSTDKATVYSILPGRGFEQASKILGAEFSGFLVRDGWAPYRSFAGATQQTCLAHLLRRCRERIEASPPGQAGLEHAVKDILQSSLALRDRRDRGRIGGRGLAIACGKLEAAMDRVLNSECASPDERRLVNHLLRERDALFPFLYCRGLEATNFRAEQAIRPMVVARKVWGGNRTENGARAHSVLGSVLHSCTQQLRSASDVLQRILCFPTPTQLDLELVSTR